MISLQAGQLNSRIRVKRFTTVSDGFGGSTNVSELSEPFWANVKEVDGKIIEENGKVVRTVEVKILMRSKAADVVKVGDIITYGNNGDFYRINNKFQNVLDFVTELKATKVDEG